MTNIITVTLEVYSLDTDDFYRGEIYRGLKENYKGPIGCFDEGLEHLNYIVEEK